MNKITIDGKTVVAQEGQMLIDVADSAGIHVPRFCYHSHLSVAANCRMCLVEVKGGRKPVPACATPVSAGMVVNTKSKVARDAQRSVMEFLLINHPLDCPICDQGGECELQDVSLEFGAGISRYSEAKRVVPKKDIGPLIETDLTRCIHCTRCVRFGKEIAGIQELGMVGRGEFSEIGTFLEGSVDSELSANVIDVCPVGALTSKPFRYSARPWELMERVGIAGHDSAGSHLSYHIKDNEIKRVVPKACADINEVWLSDRDRFSYEGLQTDSRCLYPQIRVGDCLQIVSWEQALDAAAEVINQHKSVQVLANESATVEELFLLKGLAAHKPNGAMDTRLNQSRFEMRYDALASLPTLEQVGYAVVIGSHLTHEHPMIAHRLRQGNVPVLSIAQQHYDWRIQSAQYLAIAPQEWLQWVQQLVKAALVYKKHNQQVSALKLDDVEVTPLVAEYAEKLLTIQSPHIFLGNAVLQHPHLSAIYGLLQALTQLSIEVTVLSPQANTMGAQQLKCHGFGSDAQLIMADSAESVLIMHGISAQDTLFSEKLVARMERGTVVALCHTMDDSIKAHADIVLPIATCAETSGTFVNITGLWQSFAAVVKAPAEVKPCWKVLRVLANHLGIDCTYMDSRSVRDAAQQTVSEGSDCDVEPLVMSECLELRGQVMVYSHPFAIDSVVRAAPALQETHIAQDASYIRVHSGSPLAELEECTVESMHHKMSLPVKASADVAEGVILLPIACYQALQSPQKVRILDKDMDVLHYG